MEFCLSGAGTVLLGWLHCIWWQVLEYEPLWVQQFHKEVKEEGLKCTFPQVCTVYSAPFCSPCLTWCRCKTTWTFTASASGRRRVRPGTGTRNSQQPRNRPSRRKLRRKGRPRNGRPRRGLALCLPPSRQLARPALQ